jgi:hypothetical protein
MNRRRGDKHEKNRKRRRRGEYKEDHEEKRKITELKFCMKFGRLDSSDESRQFITFTGIGSN